MDEEFKVFVCHSSDDKERFVEDLANKLIDNGIDVLYDDWVLSYGDSLIDLVDRIDESDVFIIVMSENSIKSKWVKEELSAGFVKKIEEGTKLIPIIIDENIEIPPSLKYVKQCRINDINDYEEEFKKLLNSILGISNKPQIGNKPKYVSFNPINGLIKLDSLIIKKLGGSLYSKNNMFSFDELIELTDNEFSKEEVFESIDVLEKAAKLNCKYGIGSKYPYTIRLTSAGIWLYGMNYEQNFGLYVKEIASTLLNDDVQTSSEVSEKVNCPNFIVDAILEIFKLKGYISGTKSTFGEIFIRGISGKGKRQLRELLD